MTIDQSFHCSLEWITAEAAERAILPRLGKPDTSAMVEERCDISLFGRRFPLNLAAGILFLSEAGSKMTRFGGSAYRVDEDSEILVAANSEELWAAAVTDIVEAGQR